MATAQTCVECKSLLGKKLQKQNKQRCKACESTFLFLQCRETAVCAHCKAEQPTSSFSAVQRRKNDLRCKSCNADVRHTITVRGIDGEHLLLQDVSRRETIADMKQRISQALGIAAFQQKLYLPARCHEDSGEQLLIDTFGICECGVEDGEVMLVKDESRTAHNCNPAAMQRRTHGFGGFRCSSRLTKQAFKEPDTRETEPREEKGEVEHTDVATLRTSQMKQMLDRRGVDAQTANLDTLGQPLALVWVGDYGGWVVHGGAGSAGFGDGDPDFEDAAVNVIGKFIRWAFPKHSRRFGAALIADFIVQGTSNLELEQLLLWQNRVKEGASVAKGIDERSSTFRMTRERAITEMSIEVDKAVSALESHDLHLALL